MSLLEDLVAWFIQGGLVTADGVDIFRDFDPDLPDELVILYLYDSQTADIRANTAVVQYVQVVVRRFQPTDARLKADNFFHYCRQENTDDDVFDLPNGRWAIIHVQQTPFKIDVDEKKRYYWGFNLAITTAAD